MRKIRELSPWVLLSPTQIHHLHTLCCPPAGGVSQLISEESLNSSLDSSEQASEAGSGGKGKGATGMSPNIDITC